MVDVPLPLLNRARRAPQSPTLTIDGRAAARLRLRMSFNPAFSAELAVISHGFFGRSAMDKSVPSGL